MSEQMILAQISDPHLRTDGGVLNNHVDSLAAMNACIEHLNNLRPRPDVAVITGDLVNEPEDYLGLKHMLNDMAMPYYVIPGNHDFPGPMRDLFGGFGYLPPDGFMNYVVEDFPLRLIMLDTGVPGQVAGAMCAARLRWLNERLAEKPDRPTVICMHHPPTATGIAYMDRHGLLRGGPAMEKIIRRHPQVKRILCGHVHRPVTIGWAGTIVSTAPSISFQMLFDLREEAASGYVMEPPACPILLWRPGAGLAGHLSFIGDYGPPRPFKG